MKPYVWIDGIDHAEVYGATTNERILSVQLGELSPSLVPLDGQQVTTGTFLFPSPLTMLRTVADDSAVTARVDPHNTLPGTQAVALAFYGRGLSFINDEPQQLADALTSGAASNHSEVVRRIMTDAIRRHGATTTSMACGPVR